MLKRVFISVYIALSLVACTKDDYVEPDPTINQTTLLYLMGTSLKSYYNSNINDAMEAVASGALGSQGALFCLYQESSSEAVLYQLSQSGEICEKVEMCRYEDFTAYDIGSLSMVVADVKSIIDYTTDKRLNLVLSSHGYGWRLSSTESKARSAFESGRTLDEDGNPLTRYLGYSSDGYLDIEDLCGELDGTQFGFILFDACLMSSVEVFYRLRSYCDYIIASPCEVMSAGFPFDEVVPEMFEEDGASYDVEGICQAYCDFYSDYGAPYATIAACVTSELETLAESIKSLELKTLTSTELKSVQAYENLSTHLFYDLGDLVGLAYVSGDYDAFEVQMAKAFPQECRLHTTKFISTLNGTSYITIDSDTYSGVSTSYMSTSSYATGWSDEPWAVAIGANN